MKPEELAKRIALDIATGVKSALVEVREGMATQLREMSERIANLPAPEKGEKGDDGQVDMEQVKTIIAEYVASIELPSIDNDMIKNHIDQTIGALELPKGEKGDKGDAGQVDMEMVKKLIVDEVTGITPPPLDMQQLKQAAEEVIATIEIPKGEKGDPGEVDIESLKQLVTQEVIASIDIPEAVKGDKGDDGQVDMEAVKSIIAEEVSKIEIPTPEKGDKGDDGQVDMEAIQQLIDAAVARAVADIEIPLPKNAVDIEIESGIDETKRYARGTYATHRGGLWRSYERTSGMRGWECIIAGANDIQVDFDGERSVTITTEKSDGNIEVKTITVPALLYRDVWRDDSEYQKNDCVTLAGSIWISAKDDNKERPGTGTDWRLAVKRGGTGKSAFDLAREAGFEGSRQEWLEQLGKKTVVKIEGAR